MGNSCKKETDSMMQLELPHFTTKETYSRAITGGSFPSSESFTAASKRTMVASRKRVSEMNKPSLNIFRISRPEFIEPVFEQSLADKYRSIKLSGPLLLEDGSTYEGQLRNNLRHGFGELVDCDGGMFEGYWYRDKRNGLGRQFMPDGKVYDGRWKDDAKNGHGRLHFDEDEFFEGHFENNFRNGYGRYYLPNGSYYEGTWVLDTNTGTGNLFDSASGTKRKVELPAGI